jgi:hypothetical protein
VRRTCPESEVSLRESERKNGKEALTVEEERGEWWTGEERDQSEYARMRR